MLSDDRVSCGMVGDDKWGYGIYWDKNHRNAAEIREKDFIVSLLYFACCNIIKTLLNSFMVFFIKIRSR